MEAIGAVSLAHRNVRDNCPDAKKELGVKLAKASFQIEKLYFFNIVGLMSWIIRDKIERSGGLRPYQISLFDTIVPFLKRVESKVRMPLGISLIAIAQKI